MDNKDLIHKLLNDIRDIDDVVDNFISYNKIPQIEIDLLLSKIQTMYDSALKLNRTNSRLSDDDIFAPLDFVDDTEESVEEVVEKTKDNISFNQIVNDLATEIKSRPTEESGDIEISGNDDIEIDLSDEQTEQPISQTIEAKQVCNEKPETVVERVEKVEPKEYKIQVTESPIKQPSVPINAEVQKAEKQPVGHEILNDHLQENKQTINDILSNQTKNMLANKLNQQAISNIKSAIDINSKIMFIRELFGGNSNKFEEIVGTLNQMKNFDEACSLLKSQGLDLENPTAVKFLEIVSRRFL